MSQPCAAVVQCSGKLRLLVGSCFSSACASTTSDVRAMLGTPQVLPRRQLLGGHGRKATLRPGRSRGRSRMGGEGDYRCWSDFRGYKATQIATDSGDDTHRAAAFYSGAKTPPASPGTHAISSYVVRLRFYPDISSSGRSRIAVYGRGVTVVEQLGVCRVVILRVVCALPECSQTPYRSA